MEDHPAKCKEINLDTCTVTGFHLVSASHLERIDKLGGDGGERLLRPGEEPVDGGAVDEPRELLRAASEGAAHRAEAQYHVQPVSHTPYEVGVQIFVRVWRAWGCNKNESGFENRSFI